MDPKKFDGPKPVTLPQGAPDQLEPEAPPAPTAEEQMARFEAALKEEDWGHQPC